MTHEAIRREIWDGYSDRAYEYLGCHKTDSGFVFRVWAPNARSVRLVGRFNNWDRSVKPMTNLGGIFEEYSTIAKEFDEYKYCIERPDGSFVLKADPYGTHTCTRPETASRVYDIGGYEWHDGEYMRTRKKKDPLFSPVNIYELHLGSWIKYEDGNPYSYSDIADDLVSYVREMGYTHIELLPIAEHPFDGSWGYQVTGYYAPTSRYGTPHGFMELVDKCHQAGIGVILDWVGAHFPKDEHGLYEFDGTCCYENRDPSRREHPEWGTRLFDFGRNEVRSFLISNICYWLREYHIDGIRADAVTNMIYKDYATDPDCWRKGYDCVNHDAISLIRDINAAAFRVNPSVMMIAEEATSYPKVTKPGYDGGLGFNFKWNMGWMHDTLDYMSADPVMRKFIHDKVTFSLTYAFSENYVLPFSHDEVVHGKLSLLNRMPGDYGAKFENLRVMYAYMMAHPGKKLLFMGGELGQFIEWDEKRELDWFLLEYDAHRHLHEYVKALNHFYLDNPPFWDNDVSWNGFSWIKVDDCDNGVFALRRIDRKGNEIIGVFNFCPVKRDNYRLGIPHACTLKPLFVSRGQVDKVKTEPIPDSGFENSALLTIPPMSATFYKMTYIRRGDKNKMGAPSASKERQLMRISEGETL